MEYLADCRARLAFDLLANTWNSVVVWTLRHGPMRPVELRERIGGISTKVLTETLRRLEFNGLIVRRTFREAPPRGHRSLQPAAHHPFVHYGRCDERHDLNPVLRGTFSASIVQ